jgi:hypothetical protein
MALPIFTKTLPWIRTYLSYDVERLKKYRGADGLYHIAVIDETMAAILRDLEVIKRHMGISDVDLGENGVEIVELTEALMLGIVSETKLQRLCGYLGRLTSTDWLALKEFWGLEYTPQQLISALHTRGPRRVTREYIMALESLGHISTAPLPLDIPCSR